MRTKIENDIYYVCSLIEYISRITKNKRADVVNAIGINGLQHLINVADVNHCLSFEQVSDEIVEEYQITHGNYDSVGRCKYKVPNFLSIGKNYQRLISDIKSESDKSYVEIMLEVFNSFISEAMSDFNSSVYYSSREYFKACYDEGYILD